MTTTKKRWRAGTIAAVPNPETPRRPRGLPARAPEGWARRGHAGHSRAKHYFAHGVSICPRQWPQDGAVLAVQPIGMCCPDCKLIRRGLPPRVRRVVVPADAGIADVVDARAPGAESPSGGDRVNGSSSLESPE